MVERSHTAGWLPQAYAPCASLARRWRTGSRRRPTPPWGAEDCYEIALELPGVSPDDIEVLVQDRSLTVQGEKRFDHEEVGRTYFFSEREFGAFQRSFRMPPDAASKQIDAAFKNGVLNLRSPKLRPAANGSRRISVRTE